MLKGVLGGVVAAIGFGVPGCQTVEPPVEGFRIVDPYAQAGAWYRGNFHMHSPHSDGIFTYAEMVKAYGSQQYGVLSITDHNQYGDQDGGIAPNGQSDSTVHDWNGDGVLHPERVFGSGVEAYVRDWTVPSRPWARDQGFRPTERHWTEVPVLIPGAEASYFGWHIGLLGHPPGAIEGPSTNLGYVARTRAAGGFVYLAHPAIWSRAPDRLIDLMPMRDFHGLEIYNGFKAVRDEEADATALWDALLSRGLRLWGLANDDAHLLPGQPEAAPFTAYNWVLASEATASGFLDALHRGSFYGSSGLVFERLAVVGQDHIVVRCSGAARLRFFGNGRLLQDVSGPAATYVVQGTEAYVRVEAEAETIEGRPRLVAWSQPFYVLQGAPGREPNPRSGSKSGRNVRLDQVGEPSVNEGCGSGCARAHGDS